jgi:signal transduction histidine kinase
MSKVLRDFILGKNNFIEDYSQYKRALLLGQLSLLSIVIVMVYFLFDTLNGDTNGYPHYLAVIAISLLSWGLTRRGQYITAIIIQVLIADAVVFFFSLAWNNQANYLFFISTSLGALALFGYKHRRLAIASVLLSMALFIVAWSGVFGVKSNNITLFINFLFVSFVCVLVLYFTINLHHHSEQITKQQNDQLKKINAELDRFVYSASHDLRAPLSSILGLIEIALRTNDKAELDSYLGMMKGRVAHLDDFIQEIIDYSRNQRMEVKNQPVNLHRMVEETTINLRYLEGADKIDIRNELAPDLTVAGDPMRLRIVLNNLLNNAIKYHDYTKPERYISVTGNASHGKFSFSVRDNGMGISGDHLDKVFNMFYRASDKSKGSGLGLYIVRESLEQLGGTVAIQSSFGVGSTFTVHVPTVKS